jgi:DNA-binding NarL/FixJ family response regulator
MSVSPDKSTVLIVDPLPLRNLGLVAVLDRLFGDRKFRLASLTPDEAEKWIDADANCSMIIYNVGGDSVADHKHLKRIKTLRARTADAPLVIMSDNDSREEIFSALSVGAQGFLYAGTNVEMAQQALSFIFKGGSYFPAAAQPKRRYPARLQAATESSSPPAERTADEGNSAADDAGSRGSIDTDLTGRQKTVLERVSHGDSNKAIARRLGIREGTVKVHVRQIMRKLGVANRTQAAMACANGAGAGAGAGMRAGNRTVKDKVDPALGHKRSGVLLANGKI